MNHPGFEPFGPLKQESAPLRNKIMQSLRRAIETGYLEPGTRLVEKDLCQQLNVSRTSLREALRQLQAEGVLTDLNNRGLAVVTVTREDAENIYRIRGVLEPMIVEQFIENAPDAELEGLKAHSERLKAAYQLGTAEEIVAIKRDFYDLICSGARNQIAFDLLKKLTLLTSPLRRRSVVRPERRKQSIAEIEQIVDAIIRRDKVAAHAAAEKHVANSARSALHSQETAKAAG
ncbi:MULTISPECIES: GntR family transcriptional regulator [unclassified Sinorhizobium]|uniref:GntR family transcriptional regulator n=1 Tax=unclassified Sinorhizobium TaxID=2613772 RepID=UPI0035239BA0